MQKSLLVKSLNREPCERTPVWIMRQAGRYLPEYRAMRKKVDFLTLCKTPEFAAEVTIQPVDIINVDAAIIFSDILVLPEAMGMELNFFENIGPKFSSPIKNENDINNLHHEKVFESLTFVADAIRLVKKNLNGKVPIIGFSGSPWTLMAYMVDGQGKTNFRFAKQMLFSNKDLAHRLLEKISYVVSEYLSLQVEAGADAVQIFDTWGGLLNPTHYIDFSLAYLENATKLFKEKYPNVPIIIFVKGAGSLSEKVSQIGCNAISLDWTSSLKKTRQGLKDKVALQGNLDPVALYASEQGIERAVKNVLDDFGSHSNCSGHVFNLGHGILPDVPVENVKLLVDTVKQQSFKYHKVVK